MPLQPSWILWIEFFNPPWINDILIYSKDRDEHTIHLRIVLQTSREHQLYDKLRKCKFFLEKVVFLGHVVSKEQINIDPWRWKRLQIG